MTCDVPVTAVTDTCDEALLQSHAFLCPPRPGHNYCYIELTLIFVGFRCVSDVNIVQSNVDAIQVYNRSGIYFGY